MARISAAQDKEGDLASSLHPPDISLFGLEETPSLAQQIKAARKRLGLSQRAFADKIGLTQAQLCRLENKPDTKPTRKTLKALSPVLAKSYSDMLVESGYNGVVTLQEEYYTLSGDSIDIPKIIDEVFQTDPDFFKCLNDFSKYGTSENIDVLKILIETMRITEMKTEEVDPNLEVLKRQFQTLKKYILDVLSVPTVI